ncbi:hypothetical protein [Pseudomonas prosekii]|uniref:hypothetical protein n=1 Tax=Pseudomonas prosekii TaxID=1148509 RepID=UPI00387B1B62
MTEPMLITGSYILKREHDLHSSPLEMAIAGMEGAAARFATDAIKDANTRLKYQSKIQQMSRLVEAEVLAGNVTAKEGVAYCQERRNNIMSEHRRFTSAQGVAVAEYIKLNGPTLQTTLDKYAHSLFKKDFDLLTEAEKSKVHYLILKKSGVANVKVTGGTKKMNLVGKVAWIVTAAFAASEIYRADNKTKETARQGIILSGGAAGGAVAGMGVSLLCGPAAPVCAIAVVFAGTVVGGILGDYVADSFDEELEEFLTWDVQ